jgi:hypothetical protein
VRNKSENAAQLSRDKRNVNVLLHPAKQMRNMFWPVVLTTEGSQREENELFQEYFSYSGHSIVLVFV